MTTLLLAITAAAHPTFRCGTEPALPPPLPPLAGPPVGLSVMDTFGDFEGRTRLTDHYAIKWGPDQTPDDADLDTMAAILEEAHDAGLELGFGAGPGQDRWYTNVYVAGTGGDVPGIDWVGGYARVDDEGNSYVVMSWEVVDHLTEGSDDRTAADWQSGVIHEVNHLHHFGSYAWFEHLWFWEVSANWFSNRLRPANQDVVGYAASPTLLPERALSTYTQDNPLTESYPYGAWPWLDGLEDTLGTAVMSEMWAPLAHDVYDDPLDELPAVLRGLGGDMEDTFVEYAVARHLLDFEEGDLVAASVERDAERYPDLDHRIARRQRGPTDGWLGPRSDRVPEALASNVWVVDELGTGTLELAFEADDKGTSGTRARFGVVALVDGVRHDLDIDRTTGAWSLPLAGGEQVELVVVSHPKEVVPGEVFPYTLALTVGPGADTGIAAPSADDPSGCGCTSAPAAGWGWLFVLWPVAWRRRGARYGGAATRRPAPPRSSRS